MDKKPNVEITDECGWILDGQQEPPPAGLKRLSPAEHQRYLDEALELEDKITNLALEIDAARQASNPKKREADSIRGDE